MNPHKRNAVSAGTGFAAAIASGFAQRYNNHKSRDPGGRNHMKKLIGLLLVLVLLSGCAGAEDAAPAMAKDLVILYTSDVHCGVDQGPD